MMYLTYLYRRQGKSRAAAPVALLPGVGVVGAGRFSTAAADDSQRLAGKVALITGAASGIGAATARRWS